MKKIMIKILIAFSVSLSLVPSMMVNSHAAITIAIDAGHQAKANLSKEAIGPGSKVKKYKVTAGATGVATKKKESVINLSVAKKLQAELIKRGYKVYMIRTSQNVNISNKPRAQRANASGASILIRLHCNSTGSRSVKGALAVSASTSNKFISKATVKKSITLSKMLLSGECQATGIRNRGISYSNTMAGTNWCKLPTTIIEMGFISNASEDRNLNKSATQTKIATGIANGVDSYFK